MPIIAVWAVGIVIAAFILYTMAVDVANIQDAKEKRTRLLIYNLTVVAGALLFMALSHFNVGEMVFKGWYERAEQAQEYNREKTQPFDAEDYKGRIFEDEAEGTTRSQGATGGR